MTNPKVLIATTGGGLARANEPAGDRLEAETLLSGTDVRCLATDPLNESRVYAGTQGSGVLRSDDRGRTWQAAGLAGRVVKALAASPVDAGVVYAGIKPAGMFVSRDGGGSWAELEAFRRIRGRWFWMSPAETPFAAYVQAIVLSPTDRQRIVAGIEAGATVRSDDGGKTWTPHLAGALRDCHSLAWHAADGDWVYEGGGSGGGAAFSRDGGCTWTPAGKAMDRHYGWAVAADGVNPEVWYVSASSGPGKAHGNGNAEAYIYRRDGSGWKRLTGGLPQPLPHMPYALISEPGVAGSIYAGLSNGDIWHSGDHGGSWRQLPVKLGGIHRALVML